MTTQTVRIVKASPADPRVLALMDAQQAELRELYVDTTEVTEAFDPQSLSGAGCVLLAAAREDGTLVGCGALKRWDAASAEVKRMYVTPDARGSGRRGRCWTPWSRGVGRTGTRGWCWRPATGSTPP